MHVYLRKSSHVTDVIISEVHAAVLKIRAFSSYGLLCNIILCLLCHISCLKQLCRNPTDASETQHGHTLVVLRILRLTKLETTLRNAPLKMILRAGKERTKSNVRYVQGISLGLRTAHRHKISY